MLARLRDEGLIEPLGTGRSATWRRLRDKTPSAALTDDLELFPAELTDPFER